MKMTEGSRQEGSSSPDIGFVSSAARSREGQSTTSCIRYREVGRQTDVH